MGDPSWSRGDWVVGCSGWVPSVTGVKAALGFWPDRMGTSVSMATDSSLRVIMGKISLEL